MDRKLLDITTVSLAMIVLGVLCREYTNHRRSETETKWIGSPVAVEIKDGFLKQNVAHDLELGLQPNGNVVWRQKTTNTVSKPK